MSAKEPYLDFAVSLARKAGGIMRKNLTLGMRKRWKADESPVTVTDLAINSMVILAVKKRFPGHDILAEEESSITHHGEYLWVCDPVDGTIPFSHGIPTCVFTIALLRHGTPVVGVIYDPFMDRMFCARAGKGATLNGKRISVSRDTALPRTITGAIDWGTAPYDLTALSVALDRAGSCPLVFGSVTYMYALIACGEIAAVAFAGSKSHDTAASALIVEEAGGKATDLHGKPLRLDRENEGYLLSNGHIHAKMLALLKRHAKRRRSRA